RRNVDLQPPLSDGSWHLVSLTFNRAANRVITYLDGHARDTNSLGFVGSASLHTQFETLIGASGPGSFAGSADIDELGIWSRPLTSWEVQEIFIKALRGQTLDQDYVPAPFIVGPP